MRQRRRVMTPEGWPRGRRTALPTQPYAAAMMNAQSRRTEREAGAPSTDMDTSPGKESAANGTTLVKIGGSTLGEHDTTLSDVVAMQRDGAQPVVVHGGGKVVSRWMERQGVRPRFVRGLRVTDEPSLEIVVAVLTGLVNKGLVATVQAMGGRAIGLSGADGGLIKAEQDDPDLGHVRRVVEVDTGPITALTDAGYMPIIASVAASASPGDDALFNLNADTAAGEIAAALSVERLILMTDVGGVQDISRRVIPRLTRGQAEELMRSRVVDGGMVPKIGACLTALDRVGTAHIVDGRRPHTLRDILAGDPMGTRVG